MSSCNCVGAQPGQPFCPCLMNTLNNKGFEMQVITDGPTIEYLPQVGLLTVSEARALLKEFDNIAAEEWTVSDPYENVFGNISFSVGPPHTDGHHYEDTVAEFYGQQGVDAARLLVAAQKHLIPLLRQVALKGI